MNGVGEAGSGSRSWRESYRFFAQDDLDSFQTLAGLLDEVVIVAAPSLQASERAA